MDSSIKLSTFYKVFDKQALWPSIEALEKQGATLVGFEPIEGKTRVGFMCRREDWERLKQAQ